MIFEICSKKDCDNKVVEINDGGYKRPLNKTWHKGFRGYCSFEHYKENELITL